MSDKSDAVDPEEGAVSENETRKAKKITFKLAKAKIIEKRRSKQKNILAEKDLDAFYSSLVYVRGHVKWKCSAGRLGARRTGSVAALRLDQFVGDDVFACQSIELGTYDRTENAADEFAILSIELYRNSKMDKGFWDTDRPGNCCCTVINRILCLIHIARHQLCDFAV